MNNQGWRWSLKRQPEQHKRRTEQIVAASAQLIQEKGFHGATLQDVADLREGMAAGAFQEVDPMVAAFVVLGASSWVYRWYRQGGRLPVDEVSAILQKVILSGLEQRRA